MKNLLSFLLLFITISLTAQKLDGYKYVYVHELKYEGGTDIFGLTGKTKNFLQKKGFLLLSEDSNQWPLEAKNNNCLIGFVNVNNEGRAKVSIEIINCKNEIVYTDKAHATNWANNYYDNFDRSLKNIFEKFPKYVFDSTKSIEKEYPTTELTNETEETIKHYLVNNILDPIEGIYKNYDGDNFYKVGIIKDKNNYKAIIIDSNLKHWKKGEVKAVFEKTAAKQLYSTEFYMFDKSKLNTFSVIENDFFLNIEFKNPDQTKTTTKFIKMFPQKESNIEEEKGISKSSGSGFFVSKNGIIATNSHVVSGSKKISVSYLDLNNETITLNAKILLDDKNNDVALLKIDDNNFKDLANVPYNISEIGEIGQKVFTIGFPLNNVMGSNFKVNDGIISSKSGILDDVRYYQISVPLQPGNSGGPLFNEEGNIIGITSSRLNGESFGTKIENVNYAIKASYLLNLYNMLPDNIKISNSFKSEKKELKEQIKILKNFVCLINVN
jgi:S1-C subfamily serine protease